MAALRRRRRQLRRHRRRDRLDLRRSSPADVGDASRVVVTATNAGGNARRSAAATAVVAARAPATRTPPSISGTPRDGETLTADPAPGRARRRSPTPTSGSAATPTAPNCVDIAGADRATYTLVAADVGHDHAVAVTATNAGGSADAPLGPDRAASPAAPPVNTVVPVDLRHAEDGSTLTADHGTWTGTTPITYTYQWQRCDAAGANCADIAGATGSTYAPDGRRRRQHDPRRR